jgi:uncharacterized membrane protein
MPTVTFVAFKVRDGHPRCTRLTQKEAMMSDRHSLSSILAGAGLGAALTYFLDPARGARRRHGVVDRFAGAAHDVEDLAGKAGRDLRNRARGAAARVQGAPAPRRSRSMLSQGTPERRLLEGGGGALLALWGAARGGLLGGIAAVSGASLLACAAVARADERIRVQKTITIGAPIDDVFGFWSRPENFPRFMEHVLEVRADGEDRWHWRVAGPASIPVEWDAELTASIRNRTIAWRSLEGSTVEHRGEVHFESLDPGTTRISVHMAYRPPAGALGHAVASFLGGDPKTLMDADLLRLKSLLETGRATAHHDEALRDQLS